jgi:hypothetical protein
MKILSRPFWWTKKSDEKYVELIRRQIRFGNKAAIIGVPLHSSLLRAQWVSDIYCSMPSPSLIKDIGSCFGR